MSKEKEEKRQRLVLALLAFVMFALNCIRIGNLSVGGDEAYSMLLARKSLAGIITETAMDVHPPLYYFILKAATLLFHENIRMLRLVSLLPVGILMLLGTTWIKKKFGFWTSVVFIAMLGVMSCVRYNTELRMYSFAMMFLVLCLLSAYEVLKGGEKDVRKYYGALILSGTAAAYLHYYALVTAAFIYLGLFICLILRSRKNILPCLLCSLVTILLYLPWLPVLWQQFNRTTQSYWIGPITKSVLAGYYRFAFGSGKLGISFGVSALLLFAITYWTAQGIKISEKHEKEKLVMTVTWERIKTLEDEKITALICFFAFGGNIAAGIILSLLFRPIFSERYIYVAVGILWLGLGILVQNALGRMKWGAAAIVILWMLGGAAGFFRLYETEKGYTRQTAETMEYMEQNLQEKDMVVSDIVDLSWTILEFHFPDSKKELTDLKPQGKDAAVIWYFAQNEASIAAAETLGYEGVFVREGAINNCPYFLYRLE